MTTPRPTYTTAAVRTLFETPGTSSLHVPEGVYRLGYPLRVPRDWVEVVGEGPRNTVFRATEGVYTPGVVSITPALDTCPISPAGLRYQDHGWFSFSDFCQNFSNLGAFTLDLTFSLPSPIPDGEWALAACLGCERHHDQPDIRYLLTVTPDGTLRYNFASDTLSRRYESSPGAIKPDVRTRVVCQFGGGRVRVWVCTQQYSKLVIDSDHGGQTQFPPHVDHVVGYVPNRFPEGAGWLEPPQGTVYHAVEVRGFALYDTSNPPAPGSSTQDTKLGIFTEFQAPDGCFFRGTVASLPAVFYWRWTSRDVPGHATWVRGIGCFGFTINFLLANQHNWSVRDVHAGDWGRYGVLLQQQAYGGSLTDVNVGAVPGVGFALLNNSSLVTMNDCHAEACAYGVLASDSDVLTMVGGWSDNNGVNLLVKGDQATVSVVGTSFGNEGTVGRHNVVLSNCGSASFDGCTFLALTAPREAIEFDHCAGGVLTAPRFGMHPDAPYAIKITDHDPLRPVRMIGEGRRWAGSSDTVPLTNDPSNLSVL